MQAKAGLGLDLRVEEAQQAHQQDGPHRRQRGRLSGRRRPARQEASPPLEKFHLLDHHHILLLFINSVCLFFDEIDRNKERKKKYLYIYIL